MKQKDKPFDYIDTHAGAGLYSLQSAYASKNKEYLSGIQHWFAPSAKDLPPLGDYLQQVQAVNPDGELKHYPGSPHLAVSLLRRDDKAWLFELHPADYPLLQQCFARKRQVQVRQQDGYQGLLALLPNASRRALVLIDPPYEIKDDYQKTIDCLVKAHNKMPNCVFMLWYPVVKRAQIEAMQNQLLASNISNIQQYELGVAEDNNRLGMTSAGLFIVNPPWTLSKTMKDWLPQVADLLSQDGKPHYKIQQLVGE